MTTWLNPVGWMGPIFDKELRVASRRKRTYWLRIFYMGALGFFLVPIWADLLPYVEWTNINSLAVSEEAIEITNRLILFQFIALQILAAIFLSSSISEEISRRTLGTLWTTPIRGFEVVAGKLASKMAILVQMLTISLPFLMMLRMFGGIPWNLILGGCFLALATMFLVGSLSLYLSVYFKKPYVVLVWVVLILGILFWLFPVSLEPISDFFGNDFSAWEPFIIATNPYACMIDSLESTSIGTYVFPVTGFVLQVVVGAILLILASRAVRNRGLRILSEQPSREEFHPERYHPKAAFLFRPWFVHMLIKRLFGPGMIWKESISPFFRVRHRMFWMTLVAIGIAFLIWGLFIAMILEMGSIIRNRDFLQNLIFLIFGFAVLLTITSSITVITREIEGQSWPILLATPLTDDRILGGKIFAVFRKSGWVWMGLVLCVLSSYWQKLVDWTDMGFWIPVFFATFWFLTAMGFYFAIRFRRVMPAVIISFITLVVLWVIPPYIIPFIQRILYGMLRTSSLWIGILGWFVHLIRIDVVFRWLFELWEYGNPLYLLTTIFDDYRYRYHSYQSEHLIFYFLFTIITYGLLGNVFCGRAVVVMRKRIFG